MGKTDAAATEQYRDWTDDFNPFLVAQLAYDREHSGASSPLLDSKVTIVTETEDFEKVQQQTEKKINHVEQFARILGSRFWRSKLAQIRAPKAAASTSRKARSHWCDIDAGQPEAYESSEREQEPKVPRPLLDAIDGQTTAPI